MMIISQKLLTLQNDNQVNHGAVVFIRGNIIDAGSSEKMLKKYPDHRVYRIENAILMPGLINVHTHLELPPLLDAVRARAFPDWVLNLIQAKKELGMNGYVIAAKQNIRSLIRSGTTTVGEICTHGVSLGILRRQAPQRGECR